MALYTYRTRWTRYLFLHRREAARAKRHLSTAPQVRIEIESLLPGLDFSETVISANNARKEGVTYLVEDASSLKSLADNSFDIVLDKGCLDCFVSRRTRRTTSGVRWRSGGGVLMGLSLIHI